MGLNRREQDSILVRMTRMLREPKRDWIGALPARWQLQDAKARFSEVVRRAGSEGPQHITVHGREEAVVISAEEYRRLTGRRTGRDLVRAFQASPHRDIEIEPSREGLHATVRDVDL
jgi:prevent-host-death family protein